MELANDHDTQNKIPFEATDFSKIRVGVKTLDDMLMGGLHENSLNLIMSSTNVRKNFDYEFFVNQFSIEWLQGSLHYI